MVIFSVFFGGLAKIPSDGVPYPVFSYVALLPWTFFANALTDSSNSLVGSANLISKVYFPRLIIPIASVLGGLVDFAIAFVVLLGLMLFFGIAPTLAVIVLPFLLLLALITALGAGLWLSALNVEYRDIRYVVPFLVQALLFATPVAYPSSLLAEPWRTLYGLNPMVGVVEGFRWALLERPAPGPDAFGIGGRCLCIAGFGRDLLSTDGKNLRGRGVNMSDVVIRVENLGKQYRIGGKQERYKTLPRIRYQNPARANSALDGGKARRSKRDLLGAERCLL